VLSNAVLFFGKGASAQEEPLPPPPAAAAPQVVPSPPPTGADVQDLARLDELLKGFASESRGYRTAGGISALVIGAAAITGGAIALDRGNSVPGFVATAGGAGAVIGGTLLLVAPFGPVNKMEKLSERIDEQRTAGKAPADIIRDVEAEWSDAAETSRSLRRTFGLIGAAIGGVAVAGGTALLIADSFGSLSRKEQDGFGGALLGLGYFSVLVGFQTFFFEEPIEASWRAYRAGRAPRSSLRPPSPPRLGFAPVLGGGTVVLGATF
jgi:hypothetical protein